MPAPLLKHLNRSLCCACRHLHQYRLYSSHSAVAYSATHTAPPQTRAHDDHLQEIDISDIPDAYSTLPDGVHAAPDSERPPSKKSKSKSKSKSKAKEISEKDLRPRRNPLEPNKVDLHLASIHAAGLEPTLADIERCRPLRQEPSYSPDYLDQYSELLDTLCRSFSKEQLRGFCVSYSLGRSFSHRGRRKAEYAEAIMEQQWGWPSLRRLEKEKRDKTEISVRSFDVSPAQLFLILGKDGADLLQLSLDFNVHISMTPKPLALRAEGVRGSLKALTERIEELKEDIVEDRFELPNRKPIRPELVQRISRIAGAYVENVGDVGQVRVCAKNEHDLQNARRLSIRAACDVQNHTPPPLMSYLPSEVPVSSLAALFSALYALFPFFSPRSLPWTMNTGGAFRIRRVGQWLGEDPTEDVEKTGGLAGGRGQLQHLSHGTQDLRDILQDEFPDIGAQYGSPSRSVTASFGHVLLTSNGAARRASILPPFKGSSPFKKVFEWLATGQMDRTFIPSVPTFLLKTPPAEQRILHRLVYQAFAPDAESVVYASPSDATDKSIASAPNRLVKFEIVLSKTKQPASEAYASAPSTEDSHAQVDNLEELGEESVIGTEDGVHQNEPSSVQPESIDLPSQCWLGSERTVDLVMPDRPMDARISVFQSTLVSPSLQPDELQTYISDLKAFLDYKDPNARKPDPPLSIVYDGVTYILHTSASVRQGVESAGVLSESILDLESNQKSTVCQVVCDKPQDEDAWGLFLRDCDRLTATTYRKGTYQEGPLGVDGQSGAL
ncbi:hypothetical protein PLICRDRAFT_171287 [Plicaturopsis crispa FD-325 SS-3]|nr:hypothetical protein PLICRDRAFT_171287 [Plicaturopsis crispa FD-325 SS-3]